MKPSISIIVPVYNVEDYLADCLNSILEQTYQEYELILVDDGSTDNSLKIAQQYVDKFPDRIFLYTKKNEGPGLARNLGIEKAKGKYLLFIDSDDVVEPTMLEELYESAFLLDTDIVFCPYYRHGLYQETTIEGVFEFDADKVYQGTDFLEASDYTVTTCSKLYRTKFIKQFLFPEHWFEDVAWLPVVMSYAKKISYVPTPFYHYLRHETSIVSSISDEQILGSLDAIRYIVEHSNKEALMTVAPFTASLILYMCTRRPAFADRYVDLLLEYKDFILSGTDREDHPRLSVRLDYYYKNFQAIPKCIYYDHFGKQQISEEEQQNIDGWIGNLVEFDATIVCLDESNCDVNEDPAIKQAYDAGRYDIVGQYFKCKRLIEHGGIALSRQVRGIKYITPLLLRTKAVFGFQNETSITDRIYASVAGHPALSEILDHFMKHLEDDLPMSAALSELLIKEHGITYSYELESNFKQKYIAAYDDSLRVYASCVLSYDYGIGTAYTDCYRKSAGTVEQPDGQYTLVDRFYYETLIQITKDYTVYQMDRERQNKACESFRLQTRINRLRKRLFWQTMRIFVLRDRSENWKINFNAVTRMKIIWYPYQVIRKLFPAKDVQQWNADRAQDKQLIYFREKLENPIEEEDEDFSNKED